MKNFILGTDWWTDCDDAVALRLLARAHKKEEIRLLGIAINACMEDSVTSLEGFLNTEGVEGMPIGIDRAAVDFGGEPPYQKRLTQYAKHYRSNADAEDAVSLYRRLLAESSEPVELVEIGFLQVLSALLESKPDEYSPKNGIELVLEKVSKIWMMAGRWDIPNGCEHNFSKTERARLASEKFCRLCPVPVTFLGWEIGKPVITASNLGKDDVLYDVLVDFGSPSGRNSWDPMTALLAMVGDEQEAGFDVVRGTASVDAESGMNTFVPSENGKHRYVKFMHEPTFYADWINRLLVE